MHPSDRQDTGELVRERDFYRQLLELGVQEELEPLLEQALGLIVSLCRARRGYIELRMPAANGREGALFWIAHGYYDEEVEQLRNAFSRGVIAQALATGVTVVTHSAIGDPRFEQLGSVRRNQTEAILCAPVGVGPPMGVLYLQDRVEPGSFSEADKARVEVFARHLAAFADRLFLRRRFREQVDATTHVRSALRSQNVVGCSRALAQVLEQVALVAPREVTVLLTGPSGSGKTQLARLVHENSPRAGGPFQELNCATFVESLVESELFGAVAGAHSTATRRTTGKLAAANGGTLFLDEVAELPLAVQAKLLQFLQDHVYYPLGSERAERADVRVIAATNADLRQAVAERRFRADLFYRLEVMTLQVPSLAQRREDIPLLVEAFCQRASERHGLGPLRVSLGALRAAELADWPGNIRELQNRVEAAAIRAAGEGVSQLERHHLFPPVDSASAPEPVTFQEATRSFQQEFVRRALEDADWNVSEAAQRLDVSRSHLYNLIAAFGLERRRG